MAHAHRLELILTLVLVLTATPEPTANFPPAAHVRFTIGLIVFTMNDIKTIIVIALLLL